MIIRRKILDPLLKLATEFPCIAITGPRQSGKTTLAKVAFPDHKYVNLENPNVADFASEDPVGFLNSCGEHVILDEIQNVPMLFNYLQEKIDNSHVNGGYILSGSRNFQLMRGISQSLAGRVSVIDLYPFCFSELPEDARNSATVNSAILNGFYPRIFAEDASPNHLYQSYLRTYVERDVRDIGGVKSLSDFRRFLRLCAARIGNVLNISSLAIDTGVDVRTVRNWLSILEESYIIKLVYPYYKNFNKRLVKSPKIYFVDTGLACNLLSLRSVDDLDISPYRGALFENLIVMDYVKSQANNCEEPDLWFWRETGTNEVDMVIGAGQNLRAIEIKSGQTFSLSWFKSMNKFCELASIANNEKFVVYGGADRVDTSKGSFVPWNEWMTEGYK